MAAVRLSSRVLGAIGEALEHRLAGEIDKRESGQPREVYERAVVWVAQEEHKRRVRGMTRKESNR